MCTDLSSPPSFVRTAVCKPFANAARLGSSGGKTAGARRLARRVSRSIRALEFAGSATRRGEGQSGITPLRAAPGGNERAGDDGDAEKRKEAWLPVDWLPVPPVADRIANSRCVSAAGRRYRRSIRQQAEAPGVREPVAEWTAPPERAMPETGWRKQRRRAGLPVSISVVTSRADPLLALALPSRRHPVREI